MGQSSDVMKLTKQVWYKHRSQRAQFPLHFGYADYVLFASNHMGRNMGAEGAKSCSMLGEIDGERLG
jgi:hypothetical protein